MCARTLVCFLSVSESLYPFEAHFMVYLHTAFTYAVAFLTDSDIETKEDVWLWNIGLHSFGHSSHSCLCCKLMH